MDNNLGKFIGQRISILLTKNNVKQKELAITLGVPDNTISYFCNGKRMPNTEQIKKIAEFFKVSADYLLGISDVSTMDKDMQYICDYTGLSEKSVEVLHGTKFFKSLLDDSTMKEFPEETIEAGRENVNLTLSIFNKFISQHYLSDISTYSSVYIANKKESLALYLKLINGLMDKGFADNDIVNEINKCENSTDLTLFRLQQLITDFAKECVKEENEALNQAKECVRVLEEIINKQVQNCNFDLDEIKKAGEQYGNNP